MNVYEFWLNDPQFVPSPSDIDGIDYVGAAEFANDNDDVAMNEIMVVGAADTEIVGAAAKSTPKKMSLRDIFGDEFHIVYLDQSRKKTGGDSPQAPAAVSLDISSDVFAETMQEPTNLSIAGDL